MREPTPLWCGNNKPHAEHQRPNNYGGQDYCSGRPEPRTQPVSALPLGFRLIPNDLRARGGLVSAEILSEFIAAVDSGDLIITRKVDQ